MKIKFNMRAVVVVLMLLICGDYTYSYAANLSKNIRENTWHAVTNEQEVARLVSVLESIMDPNNRTQINQDVIRSPIRLDQTLFNHIQEGHGSDIANFAEEDNGNTYMKILGYAIRNFIDSTPEQKNVSVHKRISFDVDNNVIETYSLTIKFPLLSYTEEGRLSESWGPDDLLIFNPRIEDEDHNYQCVKWVNIIMPPHWREEGSNEFIPGTIFFVAGA